MPQSPGDTPLTSGERKALSIAFKQGYFEVPRQSTLTELADELGESSAELSETLRQGVDKLIDEHREVLLDSS
ncbi:helix-turn-helix domain-containing protein [Haloarchaeobius amylolyticus]|uniref:helix-turn-helix domain-containing protein n=1 Tax=Haloarchaeobius amylolyticus TaxID=1198296 RepID=UPI00226F9075|nr:helix-turn-helix domain-containing protein [Haloarchaeobius amylolyticus]